MLGSAESQVPKLIIREIIFEEFQRIDHNPPTLQADRRTANLLWQYHAALRFAQ